MKAHGEYRFEDGAWRIDATPDVMMRLRRIFPRSMRGSDGAVVLSDTPEVARDLEWVLGRWPMTTRPADRARLLEGANGHRRTEAAVQEILSGSRPHLVFTEPARPAREYQLVAADLALTTGRLLLADDLGLGKSMSGLLVLRDPKALPALIVCPTHLPPQWMDELALTLPMLRAHIIRTGKVYDPAKRREMHGYSPDVLICNYHKLAGWADHLAGKVRTVIFDEAQELRRAESDKYRAAKQVAGKARLRVGLTATPVYNYGVEIHNIMSVLAPGALGSREEFGREWAAGMWSDKARVRDPAALGIHLREQGLMLRRTRKDVGRELPEVVRVPHTIDSDEQVHDRLADAALDLARKIVDGGDRKEVFTARGDFDWRMRHATGVAKAPFVADFCRMLLETEDRLVLWGWHRDVYDIWAGRLDEYKPAFYTGTESTRAKQRARDAFVDGESRILVMSLRSGAGLDGLQEAAHVGVFGELDWSPAMHDQCIGRLHRDGQDESVVAYYLVSELGADPVMADVLAIKRQQADPIRDPDAELFSELDAGPRDRVRTLAEDLLRKRGHANRSKVAA